MTPVLRNILIAAGVAVPCHAILDFIGLLVVQQTRGGFFGPSREAVSLALVSMTFLFLFGVAVYGGTGGLFAYLSRKEDLALGRLSLLGALASALGGIVPHSFFAAVQAIASTGARTPWGQSDSAALPVALAVSVGGAIVGAIIVGGASGAGGAAITTKLIAKRAEQNRQATAGSSS